MVELISFPDLLKPRRSGNKSKFKLAILRFVLGKKEFS